ncbi:MAG: hypothetical protein Q8Q31_01445 [Nanoarchaeota archaeon]|nr:hypothetical protein [Nanoarchaeota archaeon]
MDIEVLRPYTSGAVYVIGTLYCACMITGGAMKFYGDMKEAMKKREVERNGRKGIVEDLKL